jgi:hypothetical protein
MLNVSKFKVCMMLMFDAFPPPDAPGLIET